MIVDVFLRNPPIRKTFRFPNHAQANNGRLPIGSLPVILVRPFRAEAFRSGTPPARGWGIYMPAYGFAYSIGASSRNICASVAMSIEGYVGSMLVSHVPSVAVALT